MNTFKRKGMVVFTSASISFSYLYILLWKANIVTVCMQKSNVSTLIMELQGAYANYDILEDWCY